MQKNKSAQKKKFIAPEFWIGFLLGITVVAIGFFVYFRFFSPVKFPPENKKIDPALAECMFKYYDKCNSYTCEVTCDFCLFLSEKEECLAKAEECRNRCSDEYCSCMVSYCPDFDKLMDE
jgi:hypothetical protein